jgi:hypothetical protein
MGIVSSLREFTVVVGIAVLVVAAAVAGAAILEHVFPGLALISAR